MKIFTNRLIYNFIRKTQKYKYYKKKTTKNKLTSLQQNLFIKTIKMFLDKI